MELYTDVAYELSRRLTLRYSTSFSMSSRLFDHSIRQHIYAIYGLVRIADEIVDTYRGDDAKAQLDNLEQESYLAITSGYSANPIVHAFATTARQFDISQIQLAPFFASMRIDLHPQTYTDDSYAEYIHGSAEVVGLMCLKVFTAHQPDTYEQLRPGAQALGAAYQKVNFLRDMASDYHELGRLYFPGVHYESFTEQDKQTIIADIENDFSAAAVAIQQLPPSSKKAVTLSYFYYHELLDRLANESVETLKSKRIRIPILQKLRLLTAVKLGIRTI